MSSIGEKYTKWILNEVKKEEYIKTAINKGKEIDALKSEGKIEAIENEFKIVSEITGVLIPTPILDYIKGIKNVEVIKQEKDVNKIVPEGIYNSVLEQVKSKFSDRLVLKLPYNLKYEQIRIISQRIWQNTQKLIFIICPSEELNGRIITDYNNYENVELIRGFQKESDDGTIYNVNMLGDLSSLTKGQKCKSILTMRLHKYSFLSDEGVFYTIFCENVLELGRCTLIGTSVPINDRRRIGEEAKNRTMMDVLLVSEHKPFILSIKEEDVMKLRSEYKTHDDLAVKLFGEMRHPEWFERLIFCINITNNNYPYPAHFLMIGPAGSGKTRGVLKPLMISFDEVSGIVSGTSTIKGLIPSFKESPPDVGHLCRAEKIALVDEMFNFIKSGIKQGEQTNFGILKDVLDHMEKTFASGNGSINTTMNSILIAVTNEDPYNNLTSVSSICENIDRPFLSRLLIYRQSEQHIGFINSRKDYIDELGEVKSYPKLSQEFISLFSWLKNQKVTGYDGIKASIIFEKYLSIIPGSTREVYQGRYRHHLKCLVAGVCKYRWLLNKKNELIIDDNDYIFAEDIFAQIISSWIDDDGEIQRIPIRNRVHRIGFKEKLVYDFLCKEKILVNEVYNVLQKHFEFSKTEVELIIVHLTRWEVVKIIDLEFGEFYVPFWYGEEVKKDES